jgi:hypothetical protein
MDTRTLVLLQIDPGREQEAARYIASLPAVTEAVLTSSARPPRRAAHPACA